MNWTDVSAYLDSFYAEKNIPGLGVAVTVRGESVYEHFTGFADVAAGRRFAGDTLFRLYSATKLFTVTAGLMLVERGKLDLDAPLSNYLPEFANPQVRLMGGMSEPAHSPILVRHLFSMSAGIDGNRDTDAIRAVLARTDGRGPTSEVIRAMGGAPLEFHPGTHFKYGVCHDVLAGLIETVAEQRFGDFLRDNIWRPLGIIDTTFFPTPAQDARTAVHYEGFDAAAGTAKSISEGHYNLRVGTEYESGGGGLFSTVNDYIQFASALAYGEKLLRRETIDRLRTNQLNEDALRDFETMGGWSKAGYGYGLGVRTLMNRERNNSLSSNGEFGWDGARGCYVVVDPTADLAIFYAQQEGSSPWWQWHGMVRNYVYAAV